jgi:mannose-6-phosphate isomerase
MKNENRPWGEFKILKETIDFKVKELTVYPSKRLSYQYHQKRSETWIITKGIGEITLDDKISKINKGDIISIPVGMKHRVKNTGAEDLSIIEVQMGEYFGEDDIIRIADDFNRI